MMNHPSDHVPFIRTVRTLPLLAALVGLISTQSYAATRTWDGSSSAYWNTAANWAENAVPTDGDNLVFPAGPTRLATTNNTSSLRRFNSITILGANYALRGNSLTLSNGITATYAAGASASVELDITLAQGQTFECTTDNSILYVTGDITLGAYTLLADATGNMLFGGGISGTGGISKYGIGYLRLYGSTANSFSGTTRVNVGTLQFNKTSGLNAMAGDLVVGNNTGDPETVQWLQGAQVPSTTDLTVNGGAVADLNNFSEALGGLTLNGGEVRTGTGLLTLGNNVRVLSNAAPSTVSGQLSLGGVTRTFNLGICTLLLSAQIRDGGGSAGINCMGSIYQDPVTYRVYHSEVYLSGANTFAGLVFATNTSLTVSHPLALGATNQGTMLTDAWLVLTNLTVSGETLFMVGPDLGWMGSLLADRTSAWAGPVVVNGGYGYFGSLHSHASNFLDVQGAISGDGGVSVGGGTTRFSGSQANTYSGDTSCDDGLFELAKTVANGAIPGALRVGSYDGSQPGTNRLLLHNQIANTAAVTVYEGSLLDLDGHSDLIGGLTLDGGEVQTGAGTLTLGGDVAVDENTNRVARITGQVSLNAARNFDIANSPFSPDLFLTASISGAGGITKTGPGTLRLNGAAGNTYAGDTIVEEGTLELGQTAGDAIRFGTLFIGDGLGGANADVVRLVADNQLYSAVPIVITNSGWLDLNGHDDLVGPLTFSAGRASSGVGGLLQLGGNVTANYVSSGRPAIEGNVLLYANRTFNIANSSGSPDLELSAVVSGSAGFTKTGSGALAIYSANTFSGTAIVNDGLVYLYNDGALGSMAGATIVGDGGVLVVANGRAIGAEPLTLNGGGDGIAGALASIGGSNSWAGTVTLATDAVITVQTNRYLNLCGTVGGPAGFIKGQPGTLIFSGATANTFAGNAVVNEGTLLLNKSVTDGALPGPGSLTIGEYEGAFFSDVVRELDNYQIDTTVNITVNRSGWLDLDNQTDTLGNLSLYSGRVTTGTGLLRLSGDVTSVATALDWAVISGRLFLNPPTRRFDVSRGAQSSNVIPVLLIEADISGTGGLLKSGECELGLRGANTYSGLTTVTDGELMALSDSALGSPGAETIVESGAGLGLGGIYDKDIHIVGESLTLSGYLSGGGGFGTSNSWSGPITLPTNALVMAHSEGFLNLAGPIDGPGGLTKPLWANGTVIMSGADANTYAGDTQVETGSLVLNKSALDGAIPGNLIINDGGTWTPAGVVRLERANQIANNADITIANPARLELGGYYDRVDAVTGNGAITLGSGHLIAGHSGSSFTFGGVASGTGYLWKVGSGTWTLTGNNSYLGTTYIETGTLVVNGWQPASDVEIGNAGMLGGIGTVGRITSTGGALSPGVSPGILTSSNLLFDSSSEFLVELTEAGADQLRVSGKVGLANASLGLSAPGLLPAEGQQFIIVNNDLTDSITGTFAGLAEGALVSAGPRQFRITYKGGTGNDVVLTATNTAALRPALTIWHTTTNAVAVAWPLSDIAWMLHATTNLAATPISWMEIPPPYRTNGGNLQVIEAAPTGSRFYRLHGP